MARNLVEIWSQGDGHEHLLGRVRLVGGRVTFEGLSAKMVTMLHEGIEGEHPRRGEVFPSDGQKFLDAMIFEFSGSYLRAKFADENT